NGNELDTRAVERPLPQPAVQEQLTRMGLIVTGPLQPSLGLQPGVAHARVNGAQEPQLVPHLLGRWRAPVVSHPPGQVEEDGDVVPRGAGRVERLADALHAALAVRDGPL